MGFEVLKSGVAKDLILRGCDAVLGERFPTFRRHFDPSKCRSLDTDSQLRRPEFRIIMIACKSVEKVT